MPFKSLKYFRVPAVDPVNYSGRERNSPVFQSNKRPREVETNLMQKQLQISLNQNYYNEESDRPSSIPNPHAVSTGLKLSYDDEERNSSITSASGSMTAAPSIMSSFGDSVTTELDRQNEELERYVMLQGDNMLKGVKDIRQRHMTSILASIGKGMDQKLREKDLEIEAINRKNKELVERIKQVANEAQNWHYRAKYNESVVNMLKTNLQQALAQGNDQQVKEGFGDTDLENDAVSSIDPNNYLGMTNAPSKTRNHGMICRMCNMKEVSVLVMPCRHLSLCKDCDRGVNTCPREMEGKGAGGSKRTPTKSLDVPVTKGELEAVRRRKAMEDKRAAEEQERKRKAEQDRKNAEDAEKLRIEEAGRRRNAEAHRDGCTYKAFLNCNPAEFHGDSDPVIVTNWLKEIEDIFEISECSSRQRMKYASHFLKGEARHWWDMIKIARGDDVASVITWEEFEDLVMKNYSVEIALMVKKENNRQLEEGGDNKRKRESRNDDMKKIKISGEKNDNASEYKPCTICKKTHRGKCWHEDCRNCGKPGHVTKDCKADWVAPKTDCVSRYPVNRVLNIHFVFGIFAFSVFIESLKTTNYAKLDDDTPCQQEDYESMCRMIPNITNNRRPIVSRPPLATLNISFPEHDDEERRRSYLPPEHSHIQVRYVDNTVHDINQLSACDVLKKRVFAQSINYILGHHASLPTMATVNHVYLCLDVRDCNIRPEIITFAHNNRENTYQGHACAQHFDVYRRLLHNKVPSNAFMLGLSKRQDNQVATWAKLKLCDVNVDLDETSTF
nr:hypothetical protein [Tanacetum cinerariifolium]